MHVWLGLGGGSDTCWRSGGECTLVRVCFGLRCSLLQSPSHTWVSGWPPAPAPTLKFRHLSDEKDVLGLRGGSNAEVQGVCTWISALTHGGPGTQGDC